MMSGFQGRRVWPWRTTRHIAFGPQLLAGSFMEQLFERRGICIRTSSKGLHVPSLSGALMPWPMALSARKSCKLCDDCRFQVLAVKEHR